MSDSEKPKQRRRGHNEGNGRKRPDGRWEWRISLPDGRRKSFYAATRSAAKKAADEWLDEQEKGLQDASQKLSVGAFLDEWLEDTAKERVRPSTYQSYKLHIDRHIKPAIGHIRLRDLSARPINAMLRKIVDGGASPTTANLVRATLRTALSSAVKWGYVTQNVAKLTEPRRVARTRVEPLTLEQARILLDAVWDDRLGMLYHLAIYTGMRQGELLGLTWDDVDLEEKEIHVRQILTWEGTVPKLTEPKTEQSKRTIGMGKGAEAALLEQRRRLGEWEMAAARRWEEWNLVFPNSLGKPLDATNVTHRLQVKLEELKLPRQRFHDLRHLAASALIAEGADIHTVKELLGHSQIALTSNTYGHLTKKLAVDTAARMDRAFLLTPIDPKTDPIGDGTGLYEVGRGSPEKPAVAAISGQDDTE